MGILSRREWAAPKATSAIDYSRFTTPCPCGISKFETPDPKSLPDQSAQRPQVNRVELLPIFFSLRRFQIHRDGGKTRVIEEMAERFQAQFAGADSGVAIDAAPELAEAVIQMKRPYS